MTSTLLVHAPAATTSFRAEKVPAVRRRPRRRRRPYAHPYTGVLSRIVAPLARARAMCTALALPGVHEAGSRLVDAEYPLVERELRETIHDLSCGESLRTGCRPPHRAGIVVYVCRLVLYGFQVEAARIED